MESARVLISLPFRAEGMEQEHPECLRHFDARDLNRFFAALEREIRTTSEDSADLAVEEIVVGNGSCAHLTADDLTGLIRTVRENFRVSPDARIFLTMTPAGFDFYKLSAVRSLGNAEIRFEIPGLTDETLCAAGYHCDAQKAMAAPDCCFQNGFRKYSILLTAGRLPREETEMTMQKLRDLRPEAVILRNDAEADLAEAAEKTFSSAEWLRAGTGWYREKLPPASRCTVQLGFGPGGVTVFEGAALKSTSDFNFYCGHSDDFEALVRHSSED